MKRHYLLWIGIALLLYLPLIAATLDSKSPAQRPNIIIIMTDDQWLDSLWAMPIAQDRLFDRSMVFTHAYTTTPLCCPSRASILTGQYGHNTGVLRNSGAYGGINAFDPSQSLAVWLDDTGYETGIFGKYLVGYQGGAIPPGWDDWQVFIEPLSYLNFTLNQNGQIRTFDSGEYSTDYLFDQGIAFVENNQDRPFFLYLSVFAPHADPQVKPEDATLFSDYNYSEHHPAFNELDISDKPSHQQLPLVDVESTDAITRDLLRLLPPVDRGIGRLLDTLQQRGLMDNTIIVFMSDNGVLRGEHREVKKAQAYEEAIRIPLSIYTPKGHVGINDSLVLNIDIAPTILELAGVPPPDEWAFDGKSLSRILTGNKHKIRKWFYIELLGQNRHPPFWGVHTGRDVFWEYATGEREYYELQADPYQLDNAVDDLSYATRRAKLEDRLVLVRNLLQPYLLVP